MSSRSDSITHTVRSENSFVEVASGSVVVLTQDLKQARPPYVIGAEPCIVGRGDHCHLRVADRHMSLSHFQLSATPEGICVTDLASSNGTWILTGARVSNGSWKDNERERIRLKSSSAHVVGRAQLLCGYTLFDIDITGHQQVQISDRSSFGPLVGSSVPMRELYTQIAKIAPTDLSVLVTGETGTGKELVAQALHDASPRKAKPFVTIDCGNMTPTIAESTLFGHEKGAFTGAVARVRSPFHEAEGGTVFLDELGELPGEIQVKLLRALEARKIKPVGSNRYEPIDVRVVAATRRNLHEEINAKNFRVDLFFRIAQAHIVTTPLRERTDDIPALVAHMVERDAAPGDTGALARLVPGALDTLKRHRWPGNVRQLRNVVAYAVKTAGAGAIDFAEALGAQAAVDEGPEAADFEAHQSASARVYFERLASDGANISAMARKSGLSRTRVRHYLRAFGIRGSDSGDA
jgi:DNA-binding NtrC family response regulator